MPVPATARLLTFQVCDVDLLQQENRTTYPVSPKICCDHRAVRDLLNT